MRRRGRGLLEFHVFVRNGTLVTQCAEHDKKTGMGMVLLWLFCRSLERRALTVKMRGTPGGCAKDGGEGEGDGTRGFGRAGAPRAADPDMTMTSDPRGSQTDYTGLKQLCFGTLASVFRRALLVGLRRTHKFPSPMSDAYEEVGRPC